jgi:hypothetical protein
MGRGALRCGLGRFFLLYGLLEVHLELAEDHPASSGGFFALWGSSE